MSEAALFGCRVLSAPRPRGVVANDVSASLSSCGPRREFAGPACARRRRWVLFLSLRRLLAS